MEPPKSARLELTDEELAKVAKIKAKKEATQVDENWLFVAEFGYYYGWGGVQAILRNEITMAEANLLLIGARKVWTGQVYDHSFASMVGSASSQSKRPNSTFKKMTKGLLRIAKADV